MFDRIDVILPKTPSTFCNGTFWKEKYSVDSKFSMTLYDTVLAYGSLISTMSRWSGDTDVSDKYRMSVEQAVKVRMSVEQLGPRHPTETMPQSSSSDG